MARAHGIDISKYQVDFDPTVKPEDIHFIVVRASYGIFTDPTFDQMHERIQPIPVRGAYHYFRSDLNWKDQADHYLTVVGDKGFHFYALDVETAYNEKSKQFARSANSWLQYVAKETGQRVVLYTNPTIYKTWLQPYGDWMKNWPLWLAQYYFEPDRDKKPALPDGVTKWHLWQYSADGNNKGAEYGVKSKHLDLDVFNGTVEELHKWVGVKAPPTVKTAPADEQKEPGAKPAAEGEIDYDALAKKLAPMVARLLKGTPRRTKPRGAGGHLSFGAPQSPGDASVDTLDGIGATSARRLLASGIETVTDVASAEMEDLMDVIGCSAERAMSFIQQAQAIVRG